MSEFYRLNNINYHVFSPAEFDAELIQMSSKDPKAAANIVRYMRDALGNAQPSYRMFVEQEIASMCTWLMSQGCQYSA